MVKIYPQSVVGRYRTIKNRANIVLLLFYFLTPWLRWYRDENAPSQAILIDLPTRRAYFFNIEIWPEEIFYIMTILIIAAFGLFLFTSILGRIWCGYTCPHTVFVDLFIKVETFFQGSRNSRIALDKMPMNSSKLVKKLLTHLVWGGLSFLFAFGWICYLYDAPSFCHDLFLGRLDTAPRSWLFGLTFTTYILAGLMREKVCTHICPYGRFQSAMLDNDSLTVTYHSWRGEPRLQKNTK
ncbi:MAG: 4Fe-4S binding protein [Candidatus Midichloria mitochondrii]